MCASNFTSQKAQHYSLLGLVSHQ